MYIPPAFADEDRDGIHATIRAARLANLVTATAEGLQVTPLPLFLDADDGEHGTLHGHLARANPQWRHFESPGEALAIFTGPHAYVSPRWYAEPNVPTWNYAVAHVYGSGRAIDDAEATGRFVEALAAKFERGVAAPWVPDYDRRLLGGIVGIEIRVRAIEGKVKLSQNRSPADRAGVVAHLRASGTDNDVALAALMVATGSPGERR